MEDPIIIVGGGISGVSCASTLSQLDPNLTIKLISCSTILKVPINVKEKGHHLESFDVDQQSGDQLTQQYGNIEIIVDTVIGLDAGEKTIFLEKNRHLKYSKLCIATGARPKLINNSCSEYVIGLRDTHSVHDLQRKISGSKRVVVVGNGGIATELVYSVEFCQVIWAIKDSSFGATFFDAGAAKFFAQCLRRARQPKETLIKRAKYAPGLDVSNNVDNFDGDNTDGNHKEINFDTHIYGSALGPDWDLDLVMRGTNNELKDVKIEFNCEVSRIYFKQDFPPSRYHHIQFEETKITKAQDLKWPIFIELNNGRIYGCDLIISATGVIPNVEPFLNGNNIKIGQDFGICVNEQMLTTEDSIYAAGDACTADWPWAYHWFQMRLWTQARQMGAYAAHCIMSHINNVDPIIYAPFELFTHITKFFGFKVVLLGLFNGQKLENQYQILLRVKENDEYIKVIMKDGHMQGALLIGETDLEETFENLIINQLDLTDLQDNLLNPSVDIEDYFD